MKSIKNKVADNRGVALIIALAVLTLLAVLGTAFTVDMRLEQKAAKNYTSGAKANFLAAAGVETAIAVLRKYAVTYPAFDYVNNYEGFSAYSPSSGPARWKKTIDIDNNGVTDITIYVIDCASQIYVNDTNANGRLTRLLNNLGSAYDDYNDPNLSSNTLGDILMSGRPPGGWLTKEEIKRTTSIDAGDFDKIKDYITVHSWFDENTVDPGALSTETRAPVNINTAPQEVLAAVVRGLAIGINEGGAGGFDYDRDGNTSDTWNNSVDSTEAKDLTDGYLKNNSFTTWFGFRTTIEAAEGVKIDDGDAAVVLANCNPNTDIMTCMPNNSWWANHVTGGTGRPAVGKNDITTGTYTTEFSFNSNGYFEIESTGTVSDPNGTTLAQKTIKTVVRIFDIWRQTTQAQFVNGTISQTAAANDLYTYPEPTETALADAVYDGQIMLANIEQTGGIFRANFNDDLDADLAGGTSTAYGTVTETSVITTPDPGDLLPDGVLVYGSGSIKTNGENLKYETNNNFPEADTDKGAVEMWIKPSYVPGTGTHYFFAMSDADGSEGVLLYDNSGTLTLSVIDDASETLSATSDISGWTAGQWHHIGATFDWDDNDAAAGGKTVIQLVLEGTVVSTVSVANGIYHVDIPGTYMYVGSATTEMSWANATIDELRISDSKTYYAANTDKYYDDTNNSLTSANVAAFTSETKTLGSDVTWGTVTWTGFTPSGYSPTSAIGLDVTEDGAAFPNKALVLPDFEDAAASNSISSVIDTSGTSIQYRVRIAGDAAPLNDTPVLDDVTITYLPRAQLVYWQEIATSEVN